MTLLSELGTFSRIPTEYIFASSELQPIGEDFREQLCASGLVRFGTFGCISFAIDEEKIFGFASADGSSSLFNQTEKAFSDFLELMKAEGISYLWRVWNYIPRITEVENDVERYHDFNTARHKALKNAGYSSSSGASASCAVGSSSDKTSICFLAGYVAPTNIENPRQVSAFAYPKDYGVTAPVFARASLVDTSVGKVLFISGTASIIGSDTVGKGDVSLQTQETLTNIGILINEANSKAGTKFDLYSFSYKVYLRNLEDFGAVKQVVEQHLPIDQVVYAKADICRPDLLVEIEATSTNILTIEK